MDNCKHSSLLFSLHFSALSSRFQGFASSISVRLFVCECVMEQRNIIIASFYQQIIPADWPGSRGGFFRSFNQFCLCENLLPEVIWTAGCIFVCKKFIDFLCSHCSIGHAELSLSLSPMKLIVFFPFLLFVSLIQLCAPCTHCENEIAIICFVVCIFGIGCLQSTPSDI